MTDLPIRFVGEDKSKAAAESARKGIEGVGKAAKDAQGPVGGLTGALGKMGPAGQQAASTLSKMQGGLGSANSAVKLLTGGVLGLAAALGAGALANGAQALFSLGQQAAGVQQLRNSFDGLAQSVGTNAQAMLGALREASAGMISDQNLMLAANKAMMLGVADTSQEMTALMEVARSRGAAMGLDVTQAFSDIVTGLGRMSPLILDNLGITVNMEAAMQEYATSVGKAADALSDAERKQALVNAVMAQSEGITSAQTDGAKTAAESFAAMSASIDNLKVALGTLVAGPLAQFADGVTNVVNRINNATAGPTALAQMRDEIDQINVSLSDPALADYSVNALMAFAPVLQGLDEVEARAQAIDLWEGWLKGAPAAREAIGETWLEMMKIAPDSSNFWARELAQLEANTLRVKELFEGIHATIAQRQTALMGGGSIGETWNAEAAANAEVLQRMLGIERARRAEIEQTTASIQKQIDTFSNSIAMQVGATGAMQINDELKAALEERIRIQETIHMSEQQMALENAIWFQNQTAAILGSADAMGVMAGGTAGAAAEFNRLIPLLVTTELTASNLGLALMSSVTMGAAAATDAIAAFVGYAQSALSGVFGWLSSISGMGITGAGSNPAPNPAEMAKRSRRQSGRTNRGGSGETAPSYDGPQYNAPPPDMSAIYNPPGASTRTLPELSALGASAGKAAGALDGTAASAADMQSTLQGWLQSIPGLFGASEVTADQMRLAELGVPQNFADNYLRRLTDEVLNGVDWEGVDIKDAAARAGIDQALDPKVILELFTQKWQDSSLFANPANLELIDTEAVQAAIEEKLASEQGKLNIMELFGIDTTQAEADLAALGAQFRDYMVGGVGDSENMGEVAKPFVGNIGDQLSTPQAQAQQQELGAMIADEVHKGYMDRAKDLNWTPPNAGPSTPPATPPGAPPAAPPATGAAVGASYWQGGTVWVHRNEMLDLPRGARIYNEREAQRMGGATNVFHTTIANGMDEARFRHMVKKVLREGARM